jgi:hypothetical protein
MALLRRRADFPLRAWDQSLISSTQLLGPPVGLTLPSNSYTRGPPSPFLKKQMRRARNNPKWGKLTIRLARHICRPQMMKLQKCRCNIAALTYNIYMKSSCGRPSASCISFRLIYTFGWPRLCRYRSFVIVVINLNSVLFLK